MFGEGDDDLLYGGDGEDKLYGGDDDILCTGGATASGGDELFGGPGINYFVHDGGGADPTATIRRGSTNHCAPVGGWWPAGCTYVWATCL